MSIPDYQTLMLPVLREAAKGPSRVSDLLDSIADEFSLTLKDREELLPSGRQRILHNRIHWAKFYLQKAGLVRSLKRGVFEASSLGREVLSRNPKRIDNNFLTQFESFKQFMAANAGHKDDLHTHNELGLQEVIPIDLAELTPEAQIDQALIALDGALRDELLARVLENSPAAFEQLIVDLLVAMGYGGSHANAARQLGRTGDGGVDGVIDEDRLGLDRVYVQAKRYATNHSVGRQDVQAFVGSLVGLGAHKGVFVTTAGFSTHALEYARHLQQRIVLIDGSRLTSLMIEHGVGVRAVRSISIKRLDHDYFEAE